jgi:hypothetical protein
MNEMNPNKRRKRDPQTNPNEAFRIICSSNSNLQMLYVKRKIIIQQLFRLIPHKPHWIYLAAEGYYTFGFAPGDDYCGYTLKARL